MGCCGSKGAAGSKANRVARWRSTGIVALRDGKLKTFPDEVIEMERSVRTVDLTHNKIIDIPAEINKLINMQRLVIGDNLIERLPGNLGKLQSLKILTLDGNRISCLPDECKTLPLVTRPCLFKFFVCLWHLEMIISFFASQFCLIVMYKLFLYLHAFHLLVGQLIKLEQLSISRNAIIYLPETIGSLRNLVILNVSDNKLKSLPESVGSCAALEELQANDNVIEDLPASLCNLSHLKSLCLDNNQVNQIPASLLKDCTSLQNISLHNNPISMDQFQLMEGFQEFEARRKKKFDKQIDSNVMISSKGLDSGVDK